MRDRKDVFGENLTRLLELKDMSQSELARRIDSTSTSVSGWCAGNFMPRTDKIQKICRVLHVSESELLLTEEERMPSNLLRPNARQIPVIGTICAGTGIVAEEHYEGDVIIDKSIRGDFALHVKGDSMVGAGIYDGDLVYIEKLTNFQEGLIYAVGIKGENDAAIRTVNIVGNNYVLSPQNPAYSPKICDMSEVFIIGRVTGLYRPFGGNL